MQIWGKTVKYILIILIALNVLGTNSSEAGHVHECLELSVESILKNPIKYDGKVVCGISKIYSKYFEELGILEITLNDYESNDIDLFIKNTLAIQNTLEADVLLETLDEETDVFYAGEVELLWDCEQGDKGNTNCTNDDILGISLKNRTVLSSKNFGEISLREDDTVYLENDYYRQNIKSCTFIEVEKLYNNPEDYYGKFSCGFARLEGRGRIVPQNTDFKNLESNIYMPTFLFNFLAKDRSKLGKIWEWPKIFFYGKVEKSDYCWGYGDDDIPCAGLRNPVPLVYPEVFIIHNE